MQINGFLGGTYQGRSTPYLSDRTVNFYPELSNNPAVKQVIAMFGTPGTLLFTTAGGGPIRGSHVFNGVMFVVSGSGLYSIDSYGTVSSLLGTLSTSTGPVQMVDNGLSNAGIGGNQLAVVDGSHVYIYNVSTTVFTTVSTTFSPSSISFIDGYFAISDKDTMSSYCSNLYDGLTWGALATSPISSSPDKLISCKNLREELWMVKEYCTEVWYNAGVATSLGFPFQRLPGVVIDIGTAAKDSVSILDNSVFMLAQSKSNQEGHLVGVIQFQGYTPTPIMPPPLIYKISRFSTVSDAISWPYSADGHNFYVITFPSGNCTLAYDTTTQMWHERSTYVDSPYNVGRHLMNSLSVFNGKIYVGDYRNGNIYEMSNDYINENGDPIASIRISPHLFDQDEIGNVFIDKLVVDIEGGVGDSSGSDPNAELSWSNDGGKTWSNPYPASMGKQGEYRKDLRWRRLGYSRNRVFQLMISDDCKKVLLGAYMEWSK